MGSSSSTDKEKRKKNPQQPINFMKKNKNSIQTIILSNKTYLCGETTNGLHLKRSLWLRSAGCILGGKI